MTEAMHRVLLLMLVGVATCAATSVTSTNSDNDHGVPRPVQRVEDYPFGDPRRCLEVARRNGYKMRRFEVLPGFGWDNICNVNEGQVVNFNFSQCRTTDDGRFLLPDTVSAIPVKASRVQVFAELITHWTNWTSSTSRTINVDVGLGLSKFSISGKFSSEFQEMKSKQIGDKSVTTRAQIRYVRYDVQLQPDTPLHPTFKSRLLGIAAAQELQQKERARFLSQLLLRDFGTHIVTKASAGAALEQVDYLHEDWVMKQQEQKSDILASASASLFDIFHMSPSYETKTDKKMLDSYRKQRTFSSVLTKGGPLFQPANFTPNNWAIEVDGDLVALDLSGDPLYYVITESALPELPASTLNEVYESVKEAVETYYSYNRIPGCLDPSSPNFSPAANTEDGSCKPPPTNLTFGGMYQTCDMQPGSNNGDLCGGLTQVNPMTGGYTCPPSYQAIKLHSGSTSSSRSEHVCHSSWWKKHCHDNYYSSRATYNLYWCVATGPVTPDSGYLFGGLFTSKVDNPVTRAASCPPTFFPLKVADRADLHVCISDDYELGEQYSLPFAGFISCVAGNPLSVVDSGQGQRKTKVKAAEPGSGSGSKSRGNLKQFFKDQSDEWPMRCPDGYSRHLATVDQGCQINYCVMTGSMSGPVVPPVKRPPFVPAPPVPAPPADNLVIFDPATNMWTKNKAAAKMMKLEAADPTIPHDSQSPGDSSGSMSPGAAAGISFGATMGCVILATLAVMAVRARRRGLSGSYRRLQNPLLDPQDDYGSVNNTDREASAVRVEIAGENGQ